MTTWFTSDHHFGHNNIIRYCDRPFDSADEMNEALVAGWNRQVSAQDTVFYLGDFSLKQSMMERYAPRLNGSKILVAGNHDTCHPSNHGGRWANVGTYRKYFDEVVDEYEWNGLRLHHMPYFDPDDDRLPEYRPVFDGKILLHGHVHQRWRIKDMQINVGVDVWNYELVSEDQIRAIAQEIEFASL